MLSRKQKTLFYYFASPLMWLNGHIYRCFRAPADNQRSFVHLGPGQKNYVPGWINVDANMFTGKCDLWFDLRNKLPFRNSTITAIYSHHVIEHLPDPGAHFRDVFRCLKSGGVYRMGGPNGDAAIRKFIDNDTSWFSNFPDERNSIGGKLDNFIFCRQEHLSLLTLSYLHEIMSKAGFTDIRQCLPVKETGYPDIFNPCIALESETDFDHPHTLMIEARKP